MNMKEIIENELWTWDKLMDIYGDMAFHYTHRFTNLFGFFCFELEVTATWWGQDADVPR